MKSFNIIEDNPNKYKSYKDVYFIIGARGNFEVKKESRKNHCADNNTEGMVWIYNKRSEMVVWKMVKKSSKGLFINLLGRVYLDDFKAVINKSDIDCPSCSSEYSTIIHDEYYKCNNCSRTFPTIVI